MSYDIYGRAANSGGMVSSCCRAPMSQETNDDRLTVSNWCSACRFETVPTEASPQD